MFGKKIRFYFVRPTSMPGFGAMAWIFKNIFMIMYKMVLSISGNCQFD